MKSKSLKITILSLILLFINIQESKALTAPVIFNSPTTSSMNACPNQLFTIFTELALCNGCSGLSTNNSSDFYVYQLLSYPSLAILSTSSAVNQGTYYFGRTESTPGIYKYVVKAYNTKDQTSSTSTSSVVTVKVENATINPNPNVNICTGQSVTLSANASGTPQYFYQWKLNGNNITGATNSTYVASSAGSYTVQVINNGTFNPSSIPTYQSCYSTSNPTVVAITYTPSSVNINTTSLSYCQGDSTLLSSSVAPVGSYSFQWKLNGSNISGAVGSSYYAKSPGDYTLVINPGSNCSFTSNILSISELAAPIVPIITAATTTTFCDGGSVLLNSNSTIGTSFQWLLNNSNITNATSSTYTALNSGNYQINYTLISTGCSKLSNAITVNEVIVPVPVFTYTNVLAGTTIDTTQNPDYISICQYTGNLGITATIPAIYDSYSWGFFGTNPYFTAFTGTYASSTNSKNFSASSTYYRNYGVLVTLNGCSTYGMIYMGAATVPSVPVPVISSSGSTTICQNNTVTLTGNSPQPQYTYQWKLNGTDIPGATSYNYIANTSGNYTLVMRTGECTAINTYRTSNAIAVSVIPLPISNISIPSSQSLCQGSSITLDGSISSNATTFQWQKDGVNVTNATSSTLSVSQAGSYRLIVTNSCGSSTSTEVLINVNPLPAASITTGGSTSICQGSSLVLNANTGSGFTYQWKNNGTDISGATSASYIVTASGPYTVQVTNSNNCSATSLATSVTVNPLTTPTFTQVSPICLGATLNALPTTSNNSIAGIWSPSLNNTATTNYTFTPTSTASPTCATNATMSIAVNTLPSATITASGSTSICQGGTLTLNANTGSGLNYQWKNNGTNISGATSSNYSASAAGLYTVQVTNSNNCSSTSSSTSVTVNPLTTPTFTQVAPICFGGVLGALPTASNNSINGTWSPSLDNTLTTNYTFVPTSTSSPTCATSASMTIVVNELPIAVINNGTSATICEGDSILLDASAGAGYTYQWQNNGTDILDATTNSLTITTAGDYNVNVTDNNNCSNTSLIMTLIVNSLPVVDAGADQTICEGEMVTLNGSGAAVLSWNNDVTDGISFIPLATATYSLVGTNNITGCSNTDEVIIIVNTLPIVSLLPFNDICDTAGIIQLGGGNPSGGDYNGLGISSNSFNTGLGAGTYLVNYTYTDANGCSADASENLTVIHCSAAGIEESEKIQLIIYPNPTNDKFTMNVSNDLLGKNYVIADFAGRVIAQGKINSLIQIVDLQDVSSGSYLLQIDQPTVRVIKIVKQ